MWPNDFGNSGGFPNNFNSDSQMPFNGFQGQPFFPQQGMMQFNDMNDEALDGEYQPELGFASPEAFMHNQNIHAQFSLSPFMTPHAPHPAASLMNPRAPAQMNARAAELKAELLKRKGERASSATPPTVTSGSAPMQAASQEDSKHGSSDTPNSTDEKRAQDLNELISQYSIPKSTNGATVKQEKKPSIVPDIQQSPAYPTTPAKAQAPSSKATNSVNKAKSESNEIAGKFGNRHASFGSVSEGEIFEDTTPVKVSVFSQAKEPQPKTKKPQFEEELPRNSREDHSVKPAYSRPPRDEPRRRTPPASPRVPLSNDREERREETDLRTERRIQRAEPVILESGRYIEAEKQLHPRRDPRGEENHQAQTNGTRAEPNKQAREQKLPSLGDILPHDEDLREWLEITGYHNESYRNKILNRRRAIAALDAQREKLLLEMAAEERGGLPPTIVQQSVPSMLPPPIPNKVGAQAESTATAPATEPQRDRVVSNKRPYSELQDSQDARNAEKIARVEERTVTFAQRSDDHPRAKVKVKGEEDIESRHARSSGLESGRRFSSPREEPESPRQRFEGRDRSSRERDMSPGRRAYESRAPPRGRSFNSESYRDRDISHERRPVEIRGNYRGRAFDPHYRGQGRGRGRARADSRDREYFPSGGPEFKNDSPFGSIIANGKPYRDPKGFDRGGRGETRYFIVKSFNEENVLKCIEDYVWTTQVQNGPLFKEAFETCKNVILVFSINKSRAFQGYARMESLPGTVDIPDWQRAINWESAGAFKVRWLVICATRFHRIGHLKNAYNENQAVLIGKDGQEIEENCGAGLIELIDEEADQMLRRGWFKSEDKTWDDRH